jgi:L-cysteine/cystine lyase
MLESVTLKAYRQQFLGLTNKAYFNYGGQGPLPLPSLDAIYQCYQKIHDDGPFSRRINNDTSGFLTELSDATRASIASELGVTPETITLTENVTVGCNIVLWGLDWQPGDRILISDAEHPGVIATIKELIRRFHLELDICPIVETLNQGDPVAVIAQFLQPNTRLLLVSHILRNTGQVLPLAEIVKLCHRQQPEPVRVLVDAAQSVGLLPLNLAELEVDFYAFTGHKWWCGPEGLGGLYVSPESLAKLSPTFIGWRSILYDKQGDPGEWQPNGQRYEVATSAYPLYAGLQRSIALHQEWGTSQERYQKICELSLYLWQRLSELSQVLCLQNQPPESGLVSFKIPNLISYKDLVYGLEDRRLFLRKVTNPDCLRACVHYFTERQEIDQLVETLDQLLSCNT